MCDSVPVGARAAIRRAVQLPVELVCSHRDEPVSYRASDLSVGGMWIQTCEPIRAGAVVVACFMPSGWTRELMIFAEVARVMSTRGRIAHPTVGMGLEFTDLSASDAERLEMWLRQRQRPVPRRRRPVPRVEASPQATPPSPGRPAPTPFRPAHRAWR